MSQCGMNRSSLPKCFLHCVDVSRFNYVTMTALMEMSSGRISSTCLRFLTTETKVRLLCTDRIPPTFVKLIHFTAIQFVKTKGQKVTYNAYVHVHASRRIL